MPDINNLLNFATGTNYVLFGAFEVLVVMKIAKYPFLEYEFFDGIPLDMISFFLKSF